MQMRGNDLHDFRKFAVPFPGAIAYIYIHYDDAASRRSEMQRHYEKHARCMYLLAAP